MPYLNPYMGNTSQMDPIRNWLYRLEFTASFLDGKVLAVNASDVSHPTFNFTSVIISHLNQDVKFAGRPILGPMTVTFISAYNKDAIAEIEKWMNRIYNPETEVIGFKEDYAAECELLILKPDLSTHRNYKIKGCFPENPGDGAWAWANTANETRSVIFSIDKIFPGGSGSVRIGGI